MDRSLPCLWLLLLPVGLAALVAAPRGASSQDVRCLDLEAASPPGLVGVRRLGTG